MDILSSLVFVLAGFAIVGWVVSPRTARGLDLFAAGFLPYRDAGWPHGVQEADPIPWSWSSPETGVDLGVELVEIGPAEARSTTPGEASTTRRRRG